MTVERILRAITAASDDPDAQIATWRARWLLADETTRTAMASDWQLGACDDIYTELTARITRANSDDPGSSALADAALNNPHLPIEQRRTLAERLDDTQLAAAMIRADHATSAMLLELAGQRLESAGNKPLVEAVLWCVNPGAGSHNEPAANRVAATAVAWVLRDGMSAYSPTVIHEIAAVLPLVENPSALVDHAHDLDGLLLLANTGVPLERDQLHNWLEKIRHALTGADSDTVSDDEIADAVAAVLCSSGHSISPETLTKLRDGTTPGDPAAGTPNSSLRRLGAWLTLRQQPPRTLNDQLLLQRCRTGGFNTCNRRHKHQLWNDPDGQRELLERGIGTATDTTRAWQILSEHERPRDTIELATTIGESGTLLATSADQLERHDDCNLQRFFDQETLDAAWLTASKRQPAADIRILDALAPHVTADAVASTAWSVVTDASNTRRGAANQRWWTAVLAVLAKLETREQWHCLADLSNSWTGTIGELTDCVLAVTGSETLRQ